MTLTDQDVSDPVTPWPNSVVWCSWKKSYTPPVVRNVFDSPLSIKPSCIYLDRIKKKRVKYCGFPNGKILATRRFHPPPVSTALHGDHRKPHWRRSVAVQELDLPALLDVGLGDFEPQQLPGGGEAAQSRGASEGRPLQNGQSHRPDDAHPPTVQHPQTR